MAKSSRALGIPEGIFKICPDRKHVIEKQASVCSYCRDGDSRQADGGVPQRNEVNALERLLKEAQDNEGSTGKLLVTEVRQGVDVWDSKPSPPTPPPPPENRVKNTVEHIGPGPADPGDAFDTQSYPKPDPAPAADGDVRINKTMPLRAIDPMGDAATHVMVAAGTQTPVLGWLRGVGGPVAGRSFDVSHGRNILGSEEGCSMVLPFPGIFPRHVSIRANEDGFTATLTDTNGMLRVNGIETQSLELVDGDLIEVGSAAFRFRCLLPQELGPTPRSGGSS